MHHRTTVRRADHIGGIVSIVWNWEIGPHQTCRTAAEIVDANSSVASCRDRRLHLKFSSEEKDKGAAIMNMKLEVVIAPVSDVDCVKALLGETRGSD